MDKAPLDPNHPDLGHVALTLALNALAEGALETGLVRHPKDVIFSLLSAAQDFSLRTEGNGNEERALHVVQQTLASLEDAKLTAIREGRITGSSRGGFDRRGES